MDLQLIHVYFLSILTVGVSKGIIYYACNLSRDGGT